MAFSISAAQRWKHAARLPYPQYQSFRVLLVGGNPNNRTSDIEETSFDTTFCRLYIHVPEHASTKHDGLSCAPTNPSRSGRRNSTSSTCDTMKQQGDDPESGISRQTQDQTGNGHYPDGLIAWKSRRPLSSSVNMRTAIVPHRLCPYPVTQSGTVADFEMLSHGRVLWCVQNI